MTEETLRGRLGLRVPVIQAPMAGGVTTPALVVAVSEAGGLGSVGAAYLSPGRLREDIRAVRARTVRPFGVNLFVVGTPPPPGESEVQRAARHLEGWHAELGLGAPSLPGSAQEDFEAQFEVVLQERPAVFSFTFGCLDAGRVRALREAGIVVMGTATTAREALALQEAGVDAVVLQGAGAGGHRGTFLHPFGEALVDTLDLLRQAREAVRVPLVASGGLMTGRDVRAVLDGGAELAQLGTAFLTCAEAGTAPAYRHALLEAGDDDTTLTRVFSGRPARGLRNRVTTQLPPDDVLPYPYQNALTREMRAAASAQGRAEFMSLWAGVGVRGCRDLSAAALLAELERERQGA